MTVKLNNNNYIPLHTAAIYEFNYFDVRSSLTFIHIIMSGSLIFKTNFFYQK